MSLLNPNQSQKSKPRLFVSQNHFLPVKSLIAQQMAVLFVGLSALMGNAVAQSQSADLCEEIEDARTRAISDEQELIQKEFETMQDSRDAMERCMLEVSKTIGPLVSDTSGFGGLLSMLGDSLSEEACREINTRTQEALDTARRERDNLIRNAVNDARNQAGNAVNNLIPTGGTSMPTGNGTTNLFPSGIGNNIPMNGMNRNTTPGSNGSNTQNIEEMYKKLMGQ